MGSIAVVSILENENTHDTNDSPPLEEARANAHLIMAAPDLLAACEAAIACLDHATVTMADIDDMLHKAVAKARGQS